MYRHFTISNTMGNNAAITVICIFAAIPVFGACFSFVLNYFYPFTRLSDVAEVTFVKHALRNYVTKLKLNTTEEFFCDDYPCRKEVSCCCQTIKYKKRFSNPIFSHYLHSPNNYYGIPDILLPNGEIFGRKVLTAGRFEDFLYYITNHNTLISMFFVDCECNTAQSWRFGLVWYAQESFAFFLYSLFNLILSYFTGSSEKFSFYFTFVFMPAKFIVKRTVALLMKVKTITTQEERRRLCYRVCLVCKDMLMVPLILFCSTLFYFFASLLANLAVARE